MAKKVSGIVKAVGTAAVSSEPGLGKEIERAMSQAVLDGISRGVTDPKKQRALMMAAREAAKKSYYSRQKS